MTDAKAALPGFEERFVEARGVWMRYFVGGSGPPLLLLHGLGGAASNWSALAPELARDRRVLVPELPGHGGSSPLPATPSLSPFADRVALVAAREGLLPAPVVGHSLGGLVALRLAVRRPDDVTALVLAAAAGISSTAARARLGLEVLAVLQPSRRIAPHRRRVAGSTLLRYALFGYWGAADPAALSAAAVESFLTGPELHSDTLGAARALVADDPRPELGLVRCRCIVLWGARDTQVVVADAFEYARRLRAPVRLIPGCGHLLIGERPDACLDAIRSVL